MLAAAVTNMLAGILVHQLIRQRTAFLILRKMLGLYGLVQVLQTAVGERWLLASLDNCQSGVWIAPLIGRLSGYNLGRNPWESGTKLLDLGKHKYCALTGKQSMGDSDNHCVIQFEFDYTWTLDSRIITPNQSATWCRAMCID